MDLISFKYWHWIVLGIIVGGLMGFAWTGFEPSMPRSGSVDDFKFRVGQVGEADATKGLPRITNIRILPGDTDPNGRLVSPVTFERLGVDKEGKAVYQAQSLYATAPFDGNETIEQYLTKRKVAFSNRAGPLKYLPVGYGVAAGVIGIGLIWPTMIRLLVGAGLAAPKPPKPEKTYATGEQDDGTDKPKKRFGGFGFGGGEKTADPFAAKPVVDATTDGDVDKLFQTTGKGAKEHVVAQPVSEKEKKDYGGEYYPVAKAVVKKDEKKV